MAGLWYDTQPVEAMPFPVAIPDKTPWALSSDFYQEKCPYKPLAERFRRNICLLEAFIQEKTSAYTVVRLPEAGIVHACSGFKTNKRPR
jgi:hypothetical protein